MALGQEKALRQALDPASSAGGGLHRSAKHMPERLEQGSDGAFVQTIRGRPRIDAGLEQNFVGIDIADPG
jgi:hypothetical protein